MILTIKIKGKDEERFLAHSFGFGWYRLKHKKKDRFCACWTTPATDGSTDTEFHLVEAKDIEWWDID